MTMRAILVVGDDKNKKEKIFARIFNDTVIDDEGFPYVHAFALKDRPGETMFIACDQLMLKMHPQELKDIWENVLGMERRKGITYDENLQSPDGSFLMSGVVRLAGLDQARPA